MDENSLRPDYIFEVSWEVCNKIGGIYTVVSTKAQALRKTFGDHYLLIGPDVWKETHAHPDFTEDKTLFAVWREKAEGEGLRMRVGRWNIVGDPIVILIDFTPFFTEKDKIFSKFWETYKLDSISGQWDYIEPALFGYAAGKVVESFYNFYLSGGDRIIAHFHEWMTGAGVLYLHEYVPQVGCVFTTHATVMGRAFAGNNLTLYKEIPRFDMPGMARQFGIVAKSSLEKKAAAHSDAFTTVSGITGEECEKFLDKKPDVITPNGFDSDFLPTKEVFAKLREEARAKLIRVTEALLQQQLGDNPFFILTSGRYEFRNKGLDLFIDALAKVNEIKDSDREIIAVIAVPGNHAGGRKDLLNMMERPLSKYPVAEQYTTHTLYNADTDQVLRRIAGAGLKNRPDQKVKVVFIPAYLDGNDGIFNIPYYSFLPAFDLTVFPSYYEPWGYTPLESAVFGIPTITTSLSGFGMWVTRYFPDVHLLVRSVERNDDNFSECVDHLSLLMGEYLRYSLADLESAASEKDMVVENLSWNVLINFYFEAYQIALQRVEERYELFGDKRSSPGSLYINGRPEKPVWNELFVQPRIPEKLATLKKLAFNLWWSWDYGAIELFKMIGKELWEEHQHNPISMLESLSYQELVSLEKDKRFMEKLSEVADRLNHYIEEAPVKNEELIAYFSMEYGLHESVKTYSGGLGILAGDYLKEASDRNANMIAVGLLYRYGYFQQTISVHGDQIAVYTPQKFSHLPIVPVRDESGNWVTVGIALPGRKLTAKAWKLEVGRITLYLLDSDVDENIHEDKVVTHQLYGGDWQNRFKQELLLGVGGIRLLETLGISPSVFHLNEGHAAFAGLERLRFLVQKHWLSFNQAIEMVRASTLFTTHTPVPAGHDAFTEDILRTYIPHYAERLNISWDDFMNLGRMKSNDYSEKFSLSVLAARLAGAMNGVSKIHGKVTRQMFAGLYPGYFPKELHISHVTNGVHYATWTAKNWQKLYEKSFGADFIDKMEDPVYWKRIHKVPDKTVWDERCRSKAKLVMFLRNKIKDDLNSREENPRLIIDSLEAVNEKAMYIGFARRFATYKRAHLLFSDVERLRKMLSNEDYPVRFLFAGKAHPNDKPGQDLIKRIIAISKEPDFTGKLIFLENYDMSVARNLVAGVDVWLNTPMRPLEASGTSGQKAALNGVLNLSVLDGWYAEGYRENAGWSIPEAKTYANQQFQDELDAQTIYNILENDIIPTYFDLDKDGIPHKWVSIVKNNISEIAPNYLMRRMLNDYYDKFYNDLYKRSALLRADNYRKAKENAAWKEMTMNQWSNIEVVSMKVPDSRLCPISLGEEFTAEIVLKMKEINPDNVGVELIFSQGGDKILFSKELQLVSKEKKIATYNCSFSLTSTGLYDFAFRIYPKADFLPHRMDFALMKWV